MLDLYLYNKVKKIDDHLMVRFPVIQHEENLVFHLGGKIFYQILNFP